MVAGYSIPIWSQRDIRWSGQRLGTAGSNTTIGQSGCLITSIAMANAGFSDSQKTPNVIDDIFSDGRGYANSNLVVWNAINRLLPDMSTQGQINCFNTPAPVQDIQNHLNAGHLAILQVGFGGNPSNMHFLLAHGYNGNDVMFHDPWYGDQSSFASRRYGTGDSSKDILAIHYFADGSPAPVKPQAPVANRPSPQPLLGFQRTVRAGVNVNYRREANQSSEIIKLFKAGDTLDFKGFVHGEAIDGNDVWFVGKYSGGYAFSGAFEDSGTHDLPDLTPAPPAPVAVAVEAPEPVVVPITQPSPQPEPTPEPEFTPALEVIPQEDPQVEIPEYIATWTPDDTIPQQIVAVPSADVVDVSENGKVITTLTGGTPLKPLGGYFKYKGITYVRTQQSVEKDRWFGVSQSEVKPYEPPQNEPLVNTAVPFDSIQAVSHPDAHELINDDETPQAELVLKAEHSLAGSLKALGEYLLGLLSTPLRLISLVNKIKLRKEK